MTLATLGCLFTLLGAAVSFGAAVFIDFPLPEPPDWSRRKWGNFYCSLGFLFLSLAGIFYLFKIT